jgi:hypothetical protein
MSTDLEAEIREALQARAGAVQPGTLRPARTTTRARRPRPALWSLAASIAAVAVLAVLVSVWATQRGHSPSGGGQAALSDTRWRVVAVTADGRRTAITSRRVVVDFLGGGELHADDGVNYYSGKWRPAGDGLHITDVGTTLVGYGGHDPAVLATQRGIGALTSGTAPVQAQLAGRTLRLTAQGVVLDLVRDGRPDQVGTGARPSPTASTS